MKNWDIAILTEDQFVDPQSKSPILENPLKEDGLLINAFESLQLSAGRVSWADDSFDWSSVKAAVIRGTWDYVSRLSEFQQRLQLISDKTRLINPYELVQWNIDKHYLSQLAARGIRTVPTKYYEQGDSASLTTIIQENRQKPIIIKPVISASASNTYKVQGDNAAEIQEVMNRLLAHQAMMVQPFQENVTSQGEFSFVVIDGAYTHAVQKTPKKDDFRVQDDFGGSAREHKASKAEIRFAEQVVAACEPRPTYARVDALIDNDGELALMELELIEPELWFRLCPSAAKVLAESIVRTVI